MTENDLNNQSSQVNSSLPDEEARLAAALRHMAQDIQAKPGFQAELEKKLMKSANPKAKQKPQHKTNWTLVLAWCALAAVLLVGLSWVLSTLLPHVYPPATSPEIPQATVTPIATETAVVVNPTLPPEPAVSSSPTPIGTVYVLLVQPEYDFMLQAEMPSAPAEVTVYRQVEPEKLTIDNARTVAAKLGLNGEIYNAPFGAPGDVSYRVQDGERNVIFFNSPASFQYEAGNSSAFEHPTCQAPCMPGGVSNVMLNFLNEHALVDFPMTSQVSTRQPQVEQLVQLIDGFPLFYSHQTSQGEASISSAGEVQRLDFNPVKVEAVAKLPILTAQQAWDQAIGSQNINGVELSEQSAAMPDLRIWNRQRPLDQRIEMFGYVSTYTAAEAGKSPLILFDGYPTSGNTQGIAELDRDNLFVQVWGTFLSDQKGDRNLQVEGWQASPFPSQTLTGTIQMRGDLAYLLTNGRIMRLPDAPQDLPQDRVLMFSGVVIEHPELTLEWSSISTAFGGGGGGGGGAWADIYLEGATNPLPTPVPTVPAPDLTGQRLEGVQGRPMVFIHQYSDGSTEVEIIFFTDPGQSIPEQATVYLEGEKLAGIETYHNLPVRVWGVISESKDDHYNVNIEKIEPVYPGVTVQAWLGKYEKIPLEGREVILFTNADGQQDVLSSSIGSTNGSYGAPPSIEYGSAPGDPVVVEGILIPGQTFGGYPVLTDYTVNVAPGLQSLSDYNAMSLAPVIIREPGKAGSRRIATVTKIELAYYTDEPRYQAHEPGMPLPFVQPVWRFTGTYDDGAYFELIVQALNATYLKLPE